MPANDFTLQKVSNRLLKYPPRNRHVLLEQLNFSANRPEGDFLPHPWSRMARFRPAFWHNIAVPFAVASGRPGHDAYLQIPNADERVVLADRRCGFVQEVFSGFGNSGVNLLDAGLRLLPVVAELDFAAHATLVTASQTLILFSKCGETLRTRAQSVYATSSCTDCKLRANSAKAAQG